MPEAGVVAVNQLLAIVHEREHLRSAAVDLMRAGLPANVAADICNLARTRRRECAMLRCCANPRYVLSVRIYALRIVVTILTDTRVAAAFELGPTIRAIVCDGWRVVYKGQLKNTSEAFRNAALTLLGIGSHFATGYPSARNVVGEVIGFIRDARDPPSGWWAGLNDSCGGATVALIDDAEVVVAGHDRCDVCKAKWRA